VITEQYGVSGKLDREIIDKYLQEVPDPGIVLNIGCGPNKDVLYSLGHTLVCHWRKSCNLILADVNPRAVKELQYFFVPGRIEVAVAHLNATRLTRKLRPETIDLILALELFGNLSQLGPRQSSSMNDPRTLRAFRSVLKQCCLVLKQRGVLIIGNSSDRQPFQQFAALSREAGFSILHCHESQTVRGWINPEELRYLLVLSKD